MGVIKRILPFILLLGIFVLIRLPYLSLPLDRDEGAFAYIGWIWATGQGIPYLSVFDHKPPLSHLIFGLASALGGANFQSIRLFASFYTLVIISFFYYFVLKLGSRLAAFLSTLVVVVYLSSIRLEASNFNTEMQMTLPLLIFTILMWKLSSQKKGGYLLAIFAGIVGGASILFKPIAILAVVGITFWFLVSPKKTKEVVMITLGFLILLLLVVLYFYQNGALDSAITDLLFYNQQYTKEGFKQSNIFITGEATGIIGYFNWLKKIPSTLLPFFLLSLFNLISMRHKKSVVWWLSLILIISMWIGAKTGGSREFPHYYIPLVLGMGLAFIPWANKLLTEGKYILVCLTTIFLIGWVAIPEFKYWRAEPLEIQRKQFGTQGDWFYDAVIVADWFRSNTLENESLLVWANEPQIYYYASKKSPTRFINFYGFHYLPDAQNQWMNALKEKPPDWIVTYTNDPPSFEGLNKFLNETGFYRENRRVRTYAVFKKESNLKKLN